MSRLRDTGDRVYPFHVCAFVYRLDGLETIFRTRWSALVRII